VVVGEIGNFIFVGNGRGDFVVAAGPFAEIKQSTTFAAKREVGIGILYRLFADGATEMNAFSSHGKISYELRAASNQSGSTRVCSKALQS
jgi:hypothetical protein